VDDALGVGDGAAVGALVLPTAVGQPLGWAVGVGVNRRAHQESSSRRAVVASTNVARGVGSLPWSSTILRNRPPRPAAVCGDVVAVAADTNRVDDALGAGGDDVAGGVAGLPDGVGREPDREHRPVVGAGVSVELPGPGVRVPPAAGALVAGLLEHGIDRGVR